MQDAALIEEDAERNAEQASCWSFDWVCKFRAQGYDFAAWGFDLKLSALDFGVEGLGPTVWGFWLNVWGLWIIVASAFGFFGNLSGH